jgi:cysteine synthase B
VDLDGVAILIGNTPLIPLKRVHDGGGELLAKVESFNPGGSVKDRPALWMFRDAFQSGRLTPGKRVLDATSGNTGIALAMLGAATGVGVTLCLPRNASEERKRLLQAYGAEIVLTDPLEGTDGAQAVAERMAREHPSTYVHLDQYNNPANWRAHYEGTAAEIWTQTGGRLTHFVVGLGTTGTLVGTGRRLRELKPDIEIVAVQPAGPMHGLEGMKHLESARIPGIWDGDIPTRHEFVETEVAQNWVRRLGREEGLLVGTSSGAIMEAMRRVAGEGSVVVGIFPDRGERYLGEQEP